MNLNFFGGWLGRKGGRELIFSVETTKSFVIFSFSSDCIRYLQDALNSVEPKVK